MKTSKPDIANEVTEASGHYRKPPHSAAGKRSAREYCCEHCGREFRAKPVHDRRGVVPRRFCSKLCHGAHRTAEAYVEAKAKVDRASDVRSAHRTSEPVSVLMDMATAKTLTPQQAGKLRGYLLGALRQQIPEAHRVVMGELVWTPTQARIFGILLNKCLPDLSSNFNRNENVQGDLATLSREELEAIAAGDS